MRSRADRTTGARLRRGHVDANQAEAKGDREERATLDFSRSLRSFEPWRLSALQSLNVRVALDETQRLLIVNTRTSLR